jgi:hypothetical protein
LQIEIDIGARLKLDRRYGRAALIGDRGFGSKAEQTKTGHHRQQKYEAKKPGTDNHGWERFYRTKSPGRPTKGTPASAADRLGIQSFVTVQPTVNRRYESPQFVAQIRESR